MDKVASRGSGGKLIGPACRICGCTEDRACRPFGCVWIRPRERAHRITATRICSACVFFLANLRHPNMAIVVCNAAGIPLITPRDAAEMLGQSATALELAGLITGTLSVGNA